MRQKLFTIGHSTHTLEHFQSLLMRHQVSAVCDVRSVPYSRRNPQFNREPLKEALKLSGIEYVFLGKELGARSSNPQCYVDGKVQYSCLAAEPSFQEGLKRIHKGMERYRLALMCAEKDPLTCHRTILVARELQSQQVDIEHILADGSIETSEAAESRLMALVGIAPDMLHPQADCVEQAYEVQSRKIAYVLPPGKHRGGAVRGA